MPSQQRFEGPVLEDLLEDVRERFGPDVDIIEANKVRSGGIGGFFARETFEVVVEVDDALRVPLAEDAPTYGGARRRARETDAPSGGTTLLDLVDAVDDGPAPSRRLAEDIASVDGDAMASEETIRQLLRKTEDITMADPMSQTVPPPRGTTISTDGDAFASVLARIAHSTATSPTESSEPDEVFQSFADVARSARRSPAPAPRPTEPAPTPAAPEASEQPMVRGLRRPAVAQPSEQLDVSGLSRLGLPATDLPITLPAGGDRIGSLVQIAASFPVAAPLPTTGDAVIALVGDRSGMERAIAWIQEQLGLTPEMLMLATRATSGAFPGHRRITDHEVAATRRREWRRGSQPVLVAVDAPVGLAGTAWTRQVLDALAPGAVWGVVDATRKPEDVVEWSERIGGVDALAVHGTQDTTSPAAVLTTGLPVSLVDGATATPARWAALLDERLAA